MNISTRQLTAFVQVARHRSFTRAAERMHISQAGLSLMVRELENQVGCRLFDRTTRSVVLTSAGEALMPLAERTLDQLASGICGLQEHGASLVKTLRVGCTPLLAASLMPSVCQAFRREAPDVTVRIVDDTPEELHRRIASGELNCAVGPFYKKVPNIERARLLSFELVYVCASSAASGARSPRGGIPKAMRWKDVGEAPLLQLSADSAIEELIAKQLKKNHVREAASPLAFNHIETVIGMAAAGHGSAIIPSIALSMCKSDKLDVIRLSEPTIHVGLYLITKRGRQLAPAFSAFREVLLGELEQVLQNSYIRRVKPFI